MKEMTLIRVNKSAQKPTFGVLLYEGLPFALTLERPWMDNQPSKGDVPGSCIPAARYLCTRCRKSPDYNFQDSPQFGNTFQIRDVPNRSKILFHKGNLSDDTRGCVIVGEQFEPMNGQPAVLASKKGYDEFMSILADVDEFELELRYA